MSLTRGTNYHDFLKHQEDIIRRHYSTPIYTSISRTTSLPVSRKKLNFKKSIKQKPSHTNQSSNPDQLEDEDNKHTHQTKKRGDTNFIVED